MRAILTVTIDYDDAHFTSRDDIEGTLRWGIDHLASNGMLSDEESIVDEWDINVEFKESH
jgi:hypothetical protein